MLRADKERVVEELAERLRGASTLFVADYRGLSVSELDALRTKLLEHGARFTVVKNTLTRRAAEAAGADALLALLEGPTAIAFIESGGDPVAVAKALAESARTTRVLAIRGGILDGSPVGAEDVRSLAALPPTDVLRAQVLAAIAAPLTAVLGLISAPLRDLAGLIDARVDQLEAQGEGTAAPAGAEPVAAAQTETDTPSEVVAGATAEDSEEEE
jgi:large subunit ribosomal protein L10